MSNVISLEERKKKNDGMSLVNAMNVLAATNPFNGVDLTLVENQLREEVRKDLETSGDKGMMAVLDAIESRADAMGGGAASCRLAYRAWRRKERKTWREYGIEEELVALL